MPGIKIDYAAQLRVAMAIYAVGFERDGAVPDINGLWRKASSVAKATCMKQAGAAIGAFLAPLAQGKTEGEA